MLPTSLFWNPEKDLNQKQLQNYKWYHWYDFIKPGITEPLPIWQPRYYDVMMTSLERYVNILYEMKSLYWVVKLLKEHNELRYHRLTNVLTSLAKVTFEDTFRVKPWILRCTKMFTFQCHDANVRDSGYSVPNSFPCPIRRNRQYSFRKFVSDVHIRRSYI